MRVKSLLAWVATIAGVLSVIIAYLAWQNPKNAQQTFTVVVSPERTAAGSSSREATVDFKVKRCSIEQREVSCLLSAFSRKYDRTLTINAFFTQLVDSDGDLFRISGYYDDIHLERDVERPFKLSFKVNKDLVMPARIIVKGTVDQSGFDKSFEVKRS